MTLLSATTNSKEMKIFASKVLPWYSTYYNSAKFLLVMIVIIIDRNTSEIMNRPGIVGDLKL